MVRFLIFRPIAVITTTFAFIILGIIVMFHLPVSLLPDINIPVINIKISCENYSARELENHIVRPLKEKLRQSGTIKGISSETRSNYSLIKLQFPYNSNINYAYAHVRETIDRMVGSFPEQVSRPEVVKVSAVDIPVFILNITQDTSFVDNRDFLQLSEFAETVVKKRIEQLPEVAMADINGLSNAEINIVPDEEKLRSLDLSMSDIENIMRRNNVSPLFFHIQNGQYQYNVKISDKLSSVKDIEDIYINHERNRLLQLKDISSIRLIQGDQAGLYLNNMSSAIALAIIKHPGARITQLRSKVECIIEDLKKKHPELHFEISQDQSHLLEFSLTNLRQSLFLGIVLSFLIMLLFVRDFRSPLIIGIGVPVSLIVSMLVFNLFGVSLNMISLSGLILGVGMMVDNSIIVIDNINQVRKENRSISDACIDGTNEVIKPLLTSLLTTFAVFVPLVFLSDIAGALFYDQAIAVVITLSISFLASIMLLPALFNLFFAGRTHKTEKNKFNSSLEKYYERFLLYVLRHKFLFFCIFFSLIPVGFLFFKNIRKQNFPI